MRFIAVLLATGWLIMAAAAQSPTATEIFNLRTVCQRMAEQYFNEELNFAGAYWGGATVQSNYNAKENRCYLSIFRIASSEGERHGMSCSTTSLYDVQTKVRIPAKPPAYSRINSPTDSDIISPMDSGVIPPGCAGPCWLSNLTLVLCAGQSSLTGCLLPPPSALPFRPAA